MSQEPMIDLNDCTQFRQTLQACPPKIIHGTALLSITLLVGTVVWSSLTKANLVVRAAGRIRPVSTPTQVAASFGPRIDGRLAEVNYEQGVSVQKGQVLFRLETDQLDDDIAKQERIIDNAKEELERLTQLERLLKRRSESARDKAEAELERAQAELDRARKQRKADIRLAEVEMETAKQQADRMRHLFERSVVSGQLWEEAAARFEQAKGQLTKAELPVDDGPVEVARRALQAVEPDYESRTAELRVKMASKRGEIDAARNELASLKVERRRAALRAPISGVVISPPVKAGDVIQPGEPIVEIAPQRGFRFEAAVPSGDVGHLRAGMPVRIKFDAYDYQEYGVLSGTVRFISPDSQAPESDLQSPPVYMVRIEPAGDEVGRGERRGQVKLGMTGRAEIVIGRESLLALLVKTIHQTISLG